MKTTNKIGKHYYDLRDRSHNLDSNAYYFPFYEKDSSVAWEETFFRGVIGGTLGNYIWSDGTNIYYSNSKKQFVLNGTTWEPMTWSGLTVFNGENVWTDGTNIYYSYQSSHYKLNGTKWESIKWSGLENFDGVNVWTDGTNIYYSYTTLQYKLIDDEWKSIKWTGLDNVSNYLVGTQIWTDGNDIYFSWGEDQFKLDGTNWVAVTWSGYSDITGQHVWTDGTNIYFSYGTKQYALSEDSTTWRTVSWTGITDFYGDCIWNDGKYLYYSYFTTQYRHRIANVKYKTTLEDLKNQMGGGGVVSGYYKEADGKFYEESTYETEIVGDEGMIYIDIPTNLSYWFDGTSFHVTGSMIDVDDSLSLSSINPVQNRVITRGLNNVIITISKAEYDALSSSEKSDPSKVYYVYDDESDVGYYELEVTLSSAVTKGNTIRIPASGTDSHMSDNCTVIPTSELKSNGKPYRYSSIAVNNGYVTITAGEDIPANTKMGVVIYN